MEPSMVLASQGSVKHPDIVTAFSSPRRTSGRGERAEDSYRKNSMASRAVNQKHWMPLRRSSEVNAREEQPWISFHSTGAVVNCERED